MGCICTKDLCVYVGVYNDDDNDLLLYDGHNKHNNYKYYEYYKENIDGLVIL
jgi:hypothetical protein